MKKIRIKAKNKKGVTTVKALMKHEMLSAEQASKKGKKANYITYIVAKVNNDVVYEFSTSAILSKNPYIKFSFNGAKKGDKIAITAIDLSGDKKTTKAKIK